MARVGRGSARAAPPRPTAPLRPAVAALPYLSRASDRVGSASRNQKREAVPLRERDVELR
jgi:hypothetical protein